MYYLIKRLSKIIKKNFIPEAIANVEVTSLWTFYRIKNFKFVPFIVNCWSAMSIFVSNWIGK